MCVLKQSRQAFGISCLHVLVGHRCGKKPTAISSVHIMHSLKFNTIGASTPASFRDIGVETAVGNAAGGSVSISEAAYKSSSSSSVISQESGESGILPPGEEFGIDVICDNDTGSAVAVDEEGTMIACGKLGIAMLGKDLPGEEEGIVLT